MAVSDTAAVLPTSSPLTSCALGNAVSMSASVPVKVIEGSPLQ